MMTTALKRLAIVRYIYFRYQSHMNFFLYKGPKNLNCYEYKM